MDVGRSPGPGVWGGRGMRRVNREETYLLQLDKLDLVLDLELFLGLIDNPW